MGDTNDLVAARIEAKRKKLEEAARRRQSERSAVEGPGSPPPPATPDAPPAEPAAPASSPAPDAPPVVVLVAPPGTATAASAPAPATPVAPPTTPPATPAAAPTPPSARTPVTLSPPPATPAAPPPVTAAPAAPAPATAAATTPPGPPPTTSTAPPDERATTMAAVIVGMGIVLVIGLVGLMLTRQPSTEPVDPAGPAPVAQPTPDPATETPAPTTEAPAPTPVTETEPPAATEAPPVVATEEPAPTSTEPAPAETPAVTEEPAPVRVTEAPPPKRPEPGPTDVVAHDAPHARAEAERGRIVVHWEVSPITTHVVTAFEVLRRAGPEDAWTVVHSTVEGRSFIDEQVQPRTDYTYKVASMANVDPNDPVVRRFRLSLPPERARLESLEVGPVQTLPDTYVVPVTVSPRAADAPADAPPGFAFLRVYRWDAEGMTFQRHAFTVQEGGAVGGPAKLRGGREFDFSTGTVLEELRLETRKHPTLGHDEQVQVIVLRHPDGRLEELNDKDLPAGLPN